MSVHVGGRGPGHIARSGAAFYPAATAALDFQLQEYRIGAGSYAIRDLSALTGWSFTRASPKTALNSSGVVVPFASGVPAITDRGFLPEPAGTNKATNFNANPTDLTNVAKTGDAAATLAVADDSAVVAASVLAQVCTSGKVYKLDNSLGTTNAFANISGATGNTNTHFATVYMRGSGAVTFSGAGVLGVATNQPTYARFTASGTPTGAGVGMQIRALAGEVTYFILNQFEENSAATSPIIVTGAAATRQADAATLTYSGSPTTATVTHGSGSTATPSAASPLNLGSSSGGAWVGNYVTRVIVQ